jgi:hypothetical protein
MSGERLLITDFSPERDLGWFIVNDAVMGGKSVGAFQIDHGVLTFTGKTNTDGGGFTSIRTQPRLPSLEGCSGIIVHARGDGRRYILRLENADGVAYWGEFEPPADEASECRVSLASLRPRFRGRWLPGPPLAAGEIVGLGFMCYDGRDGALSLQVSRIEAE